jgi:hypothetical protein
MPQLIGQRFVTTQRQMIPCPNLIQTQNTENLNVQRTLATQGATPVKSGKTSFNCGKLGYFALQCPDRCQPSAPTQGATAPATRNGSSTLTQGLQNYA